MIHPGSIATLSPLGAIRAGRFSSMTDVPIPRALPETHEIFIYDAALHLGRIPKDTPFISLAQSISWVISMAMKELEKSELDPSEIRIFVIETAKLTSQAPVYHASHVYEGLKKKKYVAHKHLRYKALSEYLIYGEVPPQAISHIVSLDAVIKLANDPAAGPLLKLEILKGRKMSAVKLAILQNQSTLDNSTLLGLVEILDLFGITPMHEPNFIEDFVFGLLGNFYINFQAQSLEKTCRIWVLEYLEQQRAFFGSQTDSFKLDHDLLDSAIGAASEAFRRAEKRGLALLGSGYQAKFWHQHPDPVNAMQLEHADRLENTEVVYLEDVDAEECEGFDTEQPEDESFELVEKPKDESLELIEKPEDASNADADAEQHEDASSELIEHDDDIIMEDDQQGAKEMWERARRPY